MDVALQLYYGDLVVSKDPATLAAGAGSPAFKQQVDFENALKPPPKGASSDFKDGKGYESKVRAQLTLRINDAYDRFVKDHGLAKNRRRDVSSPTVLRQHARDVVHRWTARRDVAVKVPHGRGARGK